ncbi:MAG: hypothetical protein MK105_15275 [Crocinitomicaceae bacterium]|nr:hypothetical protein [Crocinitomicaceae bacterium]
MRFLLTIFLILFTGQLVLSNINVLTSNSEEKIVYDIQDEGQEDDTENEPEKEDSEKEEDEDEKDQNSNYFISQQKDLQSKLLEYQHRYSIYPSICLNTPYSPPDA